MFQCTMALPVITRTNSLINSMNWSSEAGYVMSTERCKVVGRKAVNKDIRELLFTSLGYTPCST